LTSPISLRWNEKEACYPQIFSLLADSQLTQLALDQAGALLEKSAPLGLQALCEAWEKGNEVQSLLFWSDNLVFLQAIQAPLCESIKLIYLDPPFATGRRFHHRKTKQAAYDDLWVDLSSFLSMLYPRLALAASLMARDSYLVLHSDHRFVHYAHALLCEIFGAEGFRNAIVWSYGGRGAKAQASQFPRNHDTLLVFSKGKPSYQPQFRMIRHPLDRLPPHIKLDERGHAFKTSPRGDYTDQSLARLEAEGRLYYTQRGAIRIKYPLPVEEKAVIEQKLIGDVWDDIPDMMHTPPKERVGYPTQKPLALLRRLLHAFSQEGDTIADLFCGSGSSLLAALQSKRRWLGCDQSEVAIRTTLQRLQEQAKTSSCRAFRLH
jgi:adenine specific DNA methylase Mod